LVLQLFSMQLYHIEVVVPVAWALCKWLWWSGHTGVHNCFGRNHTVTYRLALTPWHPVSTHDLICHSLHSAYAPPLGFVYLALRSIFLQASVTEKPCKTQLLQTITVDCHCSNPIPCHCSNPIPCHCSNPIPCHCSNPIPCSVPWLQCCQSRHADSSPLQ